MRFFSGRGGWVMSQMFLDKLNDVQYTYIKLSTSTFFMVIRLLNARFNLALAGISQARPAQSA